MSTDTDSNLSARSQAFAIMTGSVAAMLLAAWLLSADDLWALGIGLLLGMTFMYAVWLSTADDGRDTRHPEDAP